MTLLSPGELEEVKQYVLKELPRVLRQDPLFVASIEEMIREHFPGQAEFDHLLAELAAFRSEVTRRL